MNNSIVSGELQSMKYLNSKPSYKPHAHSTEICWFDKFIKIDAQQLKYNANMRSKHKISLNLDDVRCIIRILLSEML